MTFRQDNLRGLLLALGILVATLVTSFQGYLLFFNGAFYDLASTIPLRATESVQLPVVQVEVDGIAYHSDDESWYILLESLHALTPHQIVLLERPTHLRPATYQHLAGSVDLVGVSGLPWLLAGADALERVQAWANAPISDRGAFRRLSLVTPPAPHDGPTLLVRAAEGHGGSAITQNEVYPNFVRGNSKPARLDAQRFLDDEIPASIVAGKTVLLAPAPDVTAAALFTPGGRAGVTDVAAFKARALNSLITDRYLRVFPPYGATAILIVLAIGCLYFYQRAGFALALYATGGMVLLSIAISIGLLHGLFMFFPLTETLIVVLGMWIAVMNRKYVAEQQGMLLELNKISRLMQKRLVSVDVLHSERYWINIANMVQRILQLDRSIFLEALPGERRVREIHAINCDLSDIDERRRDYERTPYTTALRSRKPTAVEGFLKDSDGVAPQLLSDEPQLLSDEPQLLSDEPQLLSDELQLLSGEQQYLVPLQLEGTVLGFWAFGVNDSRMDSRKLASVTKIADDISELLYQRQQVRKAEQSDRPRWLEYLTLQGGRSLARDLKVALSVTTRRLQVVEDLFQKSETAYLLYDTFGQLLLDNPPAARLCEMLEIEAYELSYTDTLSRLTGLDLEAAKNHLQRVVLDGESVSLPIVTVPQKEIGGTLTLSTLTGNESFDAQGRVDSSSLVLSGVFIEIRLKGQGGDQLQVPDWIRRVLDMQSSMLGNLARQHFSDADERAVKQAEMISANVRGFLRAVESGLIQEGEPASFQQCLSAVLVEQESLARRKRLTVEREALNGDATPLMPRSQLAMVLGELMQFAMEDAKRGSTLHVRQLDSFPTLHLQICSDGIGIPAKRLEELRSSAPELVRDSVLSRCEALVERAGGELFITSEVGSGTMISVRLPAVPGDADC